MIMKAGDLVYIPSEVKLMQFNELDKDINPENTYIGPLKIHRLEKPINLLLIEDMSDKKYVKVWYNGDGWCVDKYDISAL